MQAIAIVMMSVFGETNNHPSFENDDYSGNPEYIKRNGHSNVITFRAGVGHTYKFNSNISNTTTVFGTGFTSNVSSAGGWTDKKHHQCGAPFRI